MSGSFAIGDKVCILRHKREIAWGHMKPEAYGFIVHINGAYIMVRPRWKPNYFVVQRYPNEIRLVKSAKKVRSKKR